VHLLVQVLYGKTLYEALHEMLALSLGECIDAKLIISKKRTELNSVVIKADEFRTILIQSARYTVNKLNDPKLTGKYKQIISASEKTKVIASILDLVALIKEHSETASQIRPAGITVDAAYLQRATDCAMALLQLRGQVTLETEPLTLAIARQKRLVTLCMESRNEIKTFAYAAFRNNLLYYKRYYTSSVRRMQNTKYKSAQ
jgi:hypothetical protein